MIIHQVTLTPKVDQHKAVVTMQVDYIKDVRKEKGCEMAEMYASHERRGDLMMMIGWKDENALLLHKQSERFRKFQDDSAFLVEEEHFQTFTHLPVVIQNDQHPLDEIYDFVYDLSLSIPFAGPTTKKILDKAHMREVGKGFMIGFKPFYPNATLAYIGHKLKKHF